MLKYQHMKTTQVAVMLCAGLMPGGLIAQQLPTPEAVAEFVDSAAPATLRDGPVAGVTVLVARGARVIVEKSYGYNDLENDVPASPRSVYEIASVTKQFTAAAIMRLVETGRLHLDDDVAPYFPRFPFGGRHVTVRQLLAHTSGVHNYIELPDRDAFLRLALSRDSLLGLIAAKPFDFEPGTQWKYSNTGYVMLGMIVEQVTTQSYADYLEQTFFTPLGMTATRGCDQRVLIPHRARGYAADSGVLVNAVNFDKSILSPAGGLCSTAHDLLTWSLALEEGRVVSPASYRLMSTETQLPNGAPRTYYGFGLTLTSLASHRAVWHDGGMPGFRARVATFPDDSLTVIVLANTISSTNNQAAELELAIDRFALGVPDIEGLVARAAAAGGGDSGVRVYRGLRRRFPAADFEPDQLNRVGYVLLRQAKVTDAIGVFRLNVEMFPSDWNAYDSLAEGYMVHGDKALAITNYEHSLKLNPANANGTQMLAKLTSASR
jgi:D-alanyl-D-alanine carboxypeptidase